MRISIGKLIFSIVLLVCLGVLGFWLIAITGISPWFLRIPMWVFGFYLGFEFIWERREVENNETEGK